jgi:dTDP-4-dehydrorhamnose reductase
LGPALLGRLTREAGIPIIQISTDYVFDGLKGAPYLESLTVLQRVVQAVAGLSWRLRVGEAAARVGQHTPPGRALRTAR